MKELLDTIDINFLRLIKSKQSVNSIEIEEKFIKITLNDWSESGKFWTRYGYNDIEIKYVRRVERIAKDGEAFQKTNSKGEKIVTDEVEKSNSALKLEIIETIKIKEEIEKSNASIKTAARDAEQAILKQKVDGKEEIKSTQEKIFNMSDKELKDEVKKSEAILIGQNDE